MRATAWRSRELCERNACHLISAGSGRSAKVDSQSKDEGQAEAWGTQWRRQEYPRVRGARSSTRVRRFLPPRPEIHLRLAAVAGEKVTVRLDGDA